MPELNSIQTYERLDGLSGPVKFKKVLERIGLWNEGIKNAFENLELVKEDNHFYYTSLSNLDHFKTNFSAIPIRPHIIIYNKGIDPTFLDNWVSYELLIETEIIENEPDFSRQDLVKKLTFELYNEFKETGTYFTNEAQDGQDFDGIRCNDLSKLWQFDYALIPLPLEKLYANPPKSHIIKKLDTYIESLKIN